MKLGMPKRIVTVALTRPITAQAASPTTTDGQNGSPSFIRIAAVIGISAKTEPTDRSNSPQIISRVTPVATNATSGRMPRTPLKFSADRNTPSERHSKSRTSTTSRTTPASSGFSR